MKRIFSILGILLFFFFTGEAQFSRYIIKFTDKGSNPFSIADPSQYLSPRSIGRRAKYNIPIDSTDLPITPRYLDSIRLSGNVTILNVSKWMNQVAIQTTDAVALAKISSFPFVLSSNPIAARVNPSADIPVNKLLDSAINNQPVQVARPQNPNDYYNYGSSNGQVKIHHGDFLHNHGFRGEGMLMCVLDAGFYHYLTLPTFDSIRANNQVISTWDFVAREQSVDEDNSHGMQCLSTIAANLPGVFVGMAPKASFHLFRTEDVGSEYPIEEQNFAAGTERADSLGVDICSVSLGYYDFDNALFNHTYADMNGDITISARAADAAAKKGMLMVAALGNEGNNSWHYLITPSDADSILSVGAVDSLGRVAGFSSYGPSSDGQIKPSVAAVGAYAVIANTSNGLPSYGFGTSFACPNMAGITTCLWQAFPEVNNMAIINALQVSANNFNSPDDRTGYGIPDVKKAFVMLQKSLYTMQSGIVDCKPLFQFSIKTDKTMSIVVERKGSAETSFTSVGTLQNSADYGMHDFTFTDDLSAIAPGIFNYRLKMIIATDTTFYLDSINLEHLPACNNSRDNQIIISPNPVTDNLQIAITRVAAARISIVLQNELGQKMYVNDFQQAAGTQVQTLKMQGMTKGGYYVTVYIDKKKVMTKKILKR